MIWTLILAMAVLPFVVFGIRTVYLSFNHRNMDSNEFLSFCGTLLFCLGVSAGAALVVLAQKLN